MKNTFILITILIFSYFPLFAQTNVSGGIYTNATWTVGGSPYIVTDTLTLFPSITLTINPGVVVKFDDGKPFYIRGTLNAIGTITDSIVFTSNSNTPNQQSWVGLMVNTGLGGIANLKYCRTMYATCAYRIEFGGYGPLNITNSVFENNFVAIGGYTYPTAIIVVDSCLFRNNTSGVSHNSATAGYFTVTNSLFQNNYYGISYGDPINATNCTFCGNSRAIYVERGTYVNCIIVNNGVGVSCSNQHGITLSGSTVAFNDTGIILYSGSFNFNEPNNIHQNTICSNNLYNIIHTGTYNEDLTNNCWCIDDSATIETTIYDGYDNVNLGLVIFTPFDTCSLGVQSSSFCSQGIDGIHNPPGNIYSYVKVYPNPAHQSFVVELPQHENYNLTVCDLTGKIIYENKTATGFSEIDCLSFNNGIYFVHAVNDKITLISKLAKQ